MGATYQDQQRFVLGFLKECYNITRTKGKDYTPDGISFLELLPSCVEADITPEQALWVLYRKHFSAIRKHFFHNQALVSEPVRGRLMDGANYFALLAWYDANRADIHQAWFRYWGKQKCECVRDFDALMEKRIEICQRCETLSWMVRRGFATDSEVTSLHSTRKAQG